MFATACNGGKHGHKSTNKHPSNCNCEHFE